MKNNRNKKKKRLQNQFTDTHKDMFDKLLECFIIASLSIYSIDSQLKLTEKEKKRNEDVFFSEVVLRVYIYRQSFKI